MGATHTIRQNAIEVSINDSPFATSAVVPGEASGPGVPEYAGIGLAEHWPMECGELHMLVFEP
jgi:hypothetical protein